MASRHVLKLYREDEELLAALARFVGDGLARGEGAVCIARPERLRLLRARLGPLADLGLLEVDAAACLASLLVGGVPDRDRFRAAVLPAFQRLADLGFPRPRLFGEMVDLLWDVDAEATLRLEALWNELLAERDGLTLLCAYQVAGDEAAARRGLLEHIRGCHSHDHDDRHRVLVIEDNHDVRDLVREGLALAGCEVATASDGAAAIAQLEAGDRPPCVILLDLMMPGMDGWQFRSWQRGHARHGAVKTVLVTATNDGAAEASKLGIPEFIAKPFQFDRLLEAVGERCATCAGIE